MELHEDYTFNPKNEGHSPLDHIVWDRLVFDDQIAPRIDPEKVQRYGADPDSAYETLIRIPGNVMPASLDVVRKAFDVRKLHKSLELPTMDVPSFGDSLKPPEVSPEAPLKAYAGMMYNDVVNASGLDVVRSLLLEPQNIVLTDLECKVRRRPDGKFDTYLRMQGEIPERIVQGINVTERGHLETDKMWDE